MKIKSDKKEVYLTGSIMTFNNEPLIFELEEDMKFSISFSADDSNEAQRIEPVLNTDDFLALKLVNFNSLSGGGTNEPLFLGTMLNRVLYFNFLVYSIKKNSQKLFHYTFYLGEEVKNG